MASRTGIPELIVGTIAAIPTIWLLPTSISINTYITLLHEYDPDISSWELAQIQLSYGSTVLAIGAFLLIAVYCYAIVLEKAIFWAYEYRKKKLSREN